MRNEKMKDTTASFEKPRPGPTNSLARYTRLAGQVVLGILIIAGLIWCILFISGFIQEQTVPDYVTIIRPPHEVSAILIDDNVVWAGGKDGIFLFDRTGYQPLPLPAGAPRFGYVRDLLLDSSGAVWIAHDGGLARYSGGSWDAFSEQSGAPFRRSLSLLEVSKDTLWVGSDQRIVIRNGYGWQELALPDGISFASADILFQDTSGAVWVGCSSPTEGGLFRYEGTEWHAYSLTDGLPHSSVNKIAQDRDGTVWVATGFASRGGAALYMNGVWSSIIQEDGLAGGSTRSVYVDRDDRIWVGSEYDGIAVLENGVWTVLTKADGLAGNEVKEMIQDEDGVYWFGTDGGLTVITNNSSFFPAEGAALP
jgi:ligand-binding sensor domain-containing protein